MLEARQTMPILDLMNQVPDPSAAIANSTCDANDCSMLIHAVHQQHLDLVVQMKEMLSELHQKQKEELGKQQAQHETRMVALVRAMSDSDSPTKRSHVPQQSGPKTAFDPFSKSHRTPEEFPPNESQQIASDSSREPSKEKCDHFSSVMEAPQPAIQELQNVGQTNNVVSGKNKVAEVRKKKNAPEVSSEARLLEIKKKQKLHQRGASKLEAWSDADIVSSRMLRRRLRKLLTHPLTEIFLSIIILCNTVFVAAQADHTAKTLSEPNNGSWEGISLFFVVFFTAEIFIRLVVEQKDFFLGKNRLWNSFDLCIVCISLFEQAFSSLSNSSVARLLRVTRLTKIARFVRVLSFFSELRTMALGIMHSFLTLVWALILLLLNMFVFAVYITPMVAYERIDIRDGKAVDAEYENELDENFGTLLSTIYSLYKAVTGGDDWSGFADLLFKIDVFSGLLFCFYVAFTTFAVLNVVSGVFIGNAFKMIEDDKDHTILEQTESRRKTIADLKEVFRNADHDKSGKINREEFDRHIEDPLVQAYFRQLGIEVEEMDSGMFDLLDFELDGAIDMEEFVSGCMHVKGSASSLDVERCNYTLRESRRDISELKDIVQGQGVAFQNIIELLRSHFDKAALLV